MDTANFLVGTVCSFQAGSWAAAPSATSVEEKNITCEADGQSPAQRTVRVDEEPRSY